MTSPSATADVLASPPERGGDNYLTHEKGLASWLLTLDHKRAVEMLAALISCEEANLPAHPLHAFPTAGRDNHGMAAPAKQLLDQPAQPGVVVDIEDAPRLIHQPSAGGSWITERNNPSWRMASAKLS